MEYLLVVGFSLLIIIPLALILNEEYALHKQDVHAEHLSEVAREIAYQAEKLYYQGAPSTTTITVSFPSGVTSANVTKGSIEFSLESSSITIYAESKAPLEGDLLEHQGMHTITLRVDDKNNLDPTDDVVIITDK